ncbi:MAG TPA: carboxypeptidase-like regulatory domain-containing protein [Gemmatimonadales bacterium]|nr:carboxypeptidase-like regulatory domain-containing protein [Gemmatimonadales bacterium]
MLMRSRGRLAGLALIICGLLPQAALEAQSRTLGTLSGSVVDDRGVVVPDAALTLTRAGSVIRVAQAEVNGRFSLAGLAPGSYSLLLEQVGYQPVRINGIPVYAGEVTALPVTLERRPPPIVAVEERDYQGGATGGSESRLMGTDVRSLARSRDASGLAEDLSAGFLSGDGRGGFGTGGNGLAPREATLAVDGVEELRLRHPGFPAESDGAVAFSRDAVSQVSLLTFAADPGLPAGSGSFLSMASAARRGPLRISPWISYSAASLGGDSRDNPADSSGASIMAGATLGGGFRADSGWWSLSLDYRSVATPAADPFPDATGRSEVIAEAAGQTTVAPWLSPTVRRWSGISGAGNVSWQPSPTSRVGARVAFATWNEENPLLAGSLSSGAGATLDGSDLSAMGSFDFWSEEWSSSTRINVQRQQREWVGESLPFTTISSDDIWLGTAASLPGNFQLRHFAATEVLTFPMGALSVKVGGTLGLKGFSTDWMSDRGGRADFGSLEDFAQGVGSWSRSTGPATEVDFNLSELTGFAWGEWRPDPTVTLGAGVRYEVEKLPTDDIPLNDELVRVFAVHNLMVPVDKASSLAPRAALTIDLDGAGSTVLQVSGGLVTGRYDPVMLAEVIRNSGAVTMHRAIGEIGWPAGSAPDGAVESTPITMFGPEGRAPRSFTLEGSIAQTLMPGSVVEVVGGYSHTDYLQRRSDYNMHSAPLASGDAGRAIWGELEQFGSLVVARPGSNRRFDQFDNIWMLRGDGYVDHKHLTARVRHQGGGLSLMASYTWSKTEDNLVGQLSPDVADRAVVLGSRPEDLEWSVGRSDLDIPGRLVLRAGYHHPSGLSLAARYRWRSGLPFTAGFQPGVDPNGDGSSGNDPVSRTAVNGLNAMLESAGCEIGGGTWVARNSCRAGAVRSLDLEAGFRLPFGGSREVQLTLSAFNLASSETGVVDRAAVLVDPDGSITTGSDGRMVLPLLINENFGSLLVRRNDPRTIRFGLRVGN